MNQDTPPQIFDRRRYRQRRQRMAPTFASHDFLHRRAMADIVDRLEITNRSFPTAAFYGAGALTTMLTEECGVGRSISIDSVSGRLPFIAEETLRPSLPDNSLVVAEEESFPIATSSVDLVVSLLTLHATNDLIAALAQARLALKPDGLFIAAVFAEGTLTFLKNALYQAETEITGGVSARIAPFATIQSLGNALSRAGFAMPVTDTDNVRVRYNNPFRLFEDLRGMGETSSLAERSTPLRRDVVARAVELFSSNGGEEIFDIVYLTGWAPDKSQPQPLKPGSAKMSLEEALKKTPS